MPSEIALWLPHLQGFRLFTSFWGSLLAVDVARGVHAPPWAAMLLVVAVVGLSSLGQWTPAALMIGGIGWLVVTGFVVNAYGELALTGLADLGRLGVMLAVSLLGSRVRWHFDAIQTPVGRVESSRRHVSTALATAGGAGVRQPGEQ